MGNLLPFDTVHSISGCEVKNSKQSSEPWFGKKLVYLSNLLRAQYLIIPIAAEESQAKYIEYSYCIKQIQRISSRARKPALKPRLHHAL